MISDLLASALLIICLSQWIAPALAKSHREKLLRNIFVRNEYDKRVRPGQESDENVANSVNISVALVQIVDLEIVKQRLSVSAIHEIIWSDWRLKWNPLEYGNLTVMNVFCSGIWTPDIILSNGIGESAKIACQGEQFEATHEGIVRGRTKRYLHVGCPIYYDEETGYPRPYQNCSLSYMSEIFNAEELSLDLIDSDIPTGSHPKVINHPCWTLLAAKPVVKQVERPGHQQIFSNVNYHLAFKWETNLPMCINFKSFS